MKHNFNKPLEDVIPHFTGLPCDCLDCVKNASYTKQLNDRNAAYVNSFDFPDWNDLKISATELLGRATNNPIAVASAKTAAQIKSTVTKEVAKANAGGSTTWTNLPKNNVGKYVVPYIDPVKIAPTSAQADINWLGWVGNLKWYIIAVMVVILGAVFLRIKG